MAFVPQQRIAGAPEEIVIGGDGIASRIVVQDANCKAA